MTSGKCPLCGRRRAGRACPALGHRICAVCCGTKRQAEIDCPPDCGYLAASQAHPPAVVQRQRERDVLFLLPMVHELSGLQQDLLLLIQALLRRDRAETPGLVDSDVEHAARSLAETCETASRGIIYEHAAGYAAAERLKERIWKLIEAVREEAKGPGFGDTDVAAVLRCIERGARDARTVLPGGDTAWLDLLQRLLADDKREPERAPDGRPAPGDSGLIVTG